MVRTLQTVVGWLLLVASPAISLSGKIVGGKETKVGEFPWMVNLQVLYEFQCAAVVYNENWILTGAACVPYTPSTYIVIAGEHNIVYPDEGEQIRTVTTVVRHPEFHSHYVNDLALLRLSAPLDYTSYVKPIPLFPSEFELPEYGMAAGWGLILGEGDWWTDVLHKAPLVIRSDEECRELHTDVPIEDSMICAGAVGTDMCAGDSGGPLMCSHPRTGELHLCGINTWNLGCGQFHDQIGVFTKITHFSQWIRNITQT